MRLLVEKIILLVLLLLFGLIAGIGPYLLRNRCLSPSRCRDRLVSLLNCFSAGVFFATFFMHMMPEAQEEFSSVFEDFTYPFAELLISSGFFFVMIIEQLVMNWYEKKSNSENESGKKSNNNSDKIYPNNSNDSNEKIECKENNNSSDNNILEKKPATAFRTRITESTSTTITEIHDLDENRTRDAQARNSIKMNELGQTSSTNVETMQRSLSAYSHHEHEHLDPHFSIRAFILLFALSTHALFEGLAIGFQSSASALRSLLVAVIIHKMALAFSFGISLVNNQANLLHVLLSMFVFSVMAPIGIGVGTALNSVKAANTTVEMVVAIMQAFAAGTFVYVIFIEIIPHEFITAKSEIRLVKLLFLVVGFAFMASLQAIPHEEE